MRQIFFSLFTDWGTEKQLHSQFSCSVVSDSLQPQGLQHARLPCPSPVPGPCSNSCPLSQWCHPTIVSSVIPFSCFLFSNESALHIVAKVLELQLQHQSFQWVFRVDFLSGWLVWSPCCPRDSQESSPVPQFESINSQCSAFFMVQLSHPFMTTGKAIAWTIWTFVDKGMPLLLNTLSRFVIAFLPRS